MIIFINGNGEIKDVDRNSLSDPALTEVEVTDGAFDGWSKAKICCYKVTVIGGKVTMMTPYVDSRLLEHIEQLGQDTEANTNGIADSEDALCELAENVETSIAQLEQAICDLSEDIGG